MQAKAVFLIAIFALLALASCSLPRGGPIASEVIGENVVPDDIAVEAVTRSSIREISKWPASGWHGHYHWFAREPGPDSRVIRSGDLVTLTIWDNQDNSLLLGPQERSVPLRPVEVTVGGTIFVPYVDHIEIGGLTTQQAREVIQGKLTPIAPSAQVQIEVKSGLRNSANVVSGVAAPGTYPLPNRNLSILSLIALSGGVSPNLDNPLVRIVRGNKAYEIPIKSLLKDPSKNVIVRGGDHLIIEEDDRFFTTFGSTQNEKLIYFDKENITAVEAVSMAGGLNDIRANPQGLLILREYAASAVKADRTGPNAQHVIFVFDLTEPDSLFGSSQFLVQPGDIVVATESAVKPAQAVIALVGSLFAISNVFN